MKCQPQPTTQQIRAWLRQGIQQSRLIVKTTDSWRERVHH